MDFKQLARAGPKPPGRAAKLGIPAPLRAIRLKCMDCSCQQIVEVRECSVTSCALWPYRMGHFPKAAQDDADPGPAAA